MCGITGLIDGNLDASKRRDDIQRAAETLRHRGPNHQEIYTHGAVALGHTRLSIIDLDDRSNQPMSDESGRYTIVFNGEIYNYVSLKSELENAGHTFKTSGDTEVLLKLFITYGVKCLEKLNGFFAFCICDSLEQKLFIARDRFGIKPLVYYYDELSFCFASELKALYQLGIKREIDKVSLFTFFKLNYIPAPATILKNTFKLEPGHCLEVTIDKTKGIELQKTTWYQIPFDPEAAARLSSADYNSSQKKLHNLIEEAVDNRMIADVPVGTFLSGGIDSSIITAVASKQNSSIESFSIGFADTPYYDESAYAAEVADHLGVKHHIFDVSQQQLFQAGQSVLSHLDEPFADSSALNVHVLSKLVSKHVTVALSGDGGDELFGGYHKHGAELKVREARLAESIVGNLGDLWTSLPSSRSGKIPNVIRQLQKFADGYKLSHRDRYWRWAGILKEEQANYLIAEPLLERNQRLSDNGHEYKKRKDHLLRAITKTGTLNQVLLSDMQMVLVNDMLHKVDSMSMQNALEVRTPLLDHRVVNFAFGLPVAYKVNSRTKKKILQDAFRHQLPQSVFNRPKKGFEVPLVEWFNGPMRADFTLLCSEEEFIREQGLLNFQAVQEIHQKLYSGNPGDSASTAWALTVFQKWYKSHMI